MRAQVQGRRLLLNDVAAVGKRFCAQEKEADTFGCTCAQ
jgi:hypothetical protein